MGIYLLLFCFLGLGGGVYSSFSGFTELLSAFTIFASLLFFY